METQHVPKQLSDYGAVMYSLVSSGHSFFNADTVEVLHADEKHSPIRYRR